MISHFSKSCFQNYHARTHMNQQHMYKFFSSLIRNIYARVLILTHTWRKIAAQVFCVHHGFLAPKSNGFSFRLCFFFAVKWIRNLQVMVVKGNVKNSIPMCTQVTVFARSSCATFLHVIFWSSPCSRWIRKLFIEKRMFKNKNLYTSWFKKIPLDGCSIEI